MVELNSVNNNVRLQANANDASGFDQFLSNTDQKAPESSTNYIKPQPEKVRIILMPTDEVMQYAKKNPQSSYAADCKTVDIKPLTPDDPKTKTIGEDWLDLDRQLTNIATQYGGEDHKLKKLVLDSHGWTGGIQIDIAGQPNDKDPNFNLVNVAEYAAPKVEPGGRLYFMGCHHTPMDGEGDKIREELSKVAVENGITIITTGTLANVGSKTSQAVLYFMKPDGTIEMHTKDYEDYLNKQVEIAELNIMRCEVMKQQLNLISAINAHNMRTMEIAREINKLYGEYLGFGSYFNSDPIKKLQFERDELKRLMEQEEKQQGPLSVELGRLDKRIKAIEDSF